MSSSRTYRSQDSQSSLAIEGSQGTGGRKNEEAGVYRAIWAVPWDGTLWYCTDYGQLNEVTKLPSTQHAGLLRESGWGKILFPYGFDDAHGY